MANAVKSKPKASTKTEKTEDGSAKKKAKKVFSVGDTVQFKGYSREVESPLFEAGATLAVVSKEKRDGVTYYSCVPADEVDAYKKDPDSVSGEELLAKELKKTKVKAPKEPKLSRVEQEAQQFRAVGALAKYVREAKTTETQVETAQRLYEKHNESGFYLGGMLAHLYYGINGQSYRELADEYKDEKDGWNKFCQDKFGFGARKGRGFVSIYMQFSRIPGIDVKRLESVGWSKLDIIAPSVTEENADELLKEAETSTVNELRDTIRTQYAAGSADGRRTRERVTRVKCGPFSLEGDQAELIKDIFKAATKEHGIEDGNQLFFHIVTSWAVENLNSARIKKAAQKAATKAETKAAA